MPWIMTKEMQASLDRESLYYLWTKIINGTGTLEQVDSYNKLAEKLKYDNIRREDRQEESNTAI